MSFLIKIAAKPTSTWVKREFLRFETAQKLLIGIGQSTHSATSRMTIWSEGWKVRSIEPLKEEAALSAGADFIGESFIFLVAGGLVVWEYGRSYEKERLKEEKRRRKKWKIYQKRL